MSKNELLTTECLRVQQKIIQAHPVNMAAVRYANLAVNLASQSDDIAMCANLLQGAKKIAVTRLSNSISELSQRFLDKAKQEPLAQVCDTSQVGYQIQEIACRHIIPDHALQAKIQDIVSGLYEYRNEVDIRRELLDEVATFINKQLSPHHAAISLQAKIEDAETIEELEQYRKQFEKLRC